MATAQPEKVIFDCDLGSDIDDAFALALLLSSQDDVEILGITVDHGNTPGRAELACKILYETGMGHIPVYVGEHTPTVVGQDTVLEGRSTQMVWSAGFDKLQPQSERAVDFILRTLSENPGAVSLITVGPVGNIAAVLEEDPKALRNAKRVVAMLGSIDVGYDGGTASPEWNVLANISAAQDLLNAGANLTLAPLDITDHVILDDGYLRAVAMRDTPLTDALGNLYALWYRHAEWAVNAKMFDGVAVGMLLWPELFETRRAHVYVDTEGYTRVMEDQAPNCTIGTQIDTQVFIDRMMQRILRQQFDR